MHDFLVASGRAAAVGGIPAGDVVVAAVVVAFGWHLLATVFEPG